MNIADQSEQEMVKTILLIYTADEKAAQAISAHIAVKLTQRRTILRERRVVPKGQKKGRETR